MVRRLTILALTLLLTTSCLYADPPDAAKSYKTVVDAHAAVLASQKDLADKQKALCDAIVAHTKNVRDAFGPFAAMPCPMPTPVPAPMPAPAPPMPAPVAPPAVVPPAPKPAPAPVPPHVEPSAKPKASVKSVQESPAAHEAAKPSPTSLGRLQLLLPEGASVAIDGYQHGTKPGTSRVFEFPGLTADTSCQVIVAANGTMMKRNVVLQPGKTTVASFTDAGK
jgi:hypothetical protein